MKWLQKTLKTLLLTFLIALFLFVSGKLFFEEKLNTALDYAKSAWKKAGTEELIIAYAQPIFNFHPLTGDAVAQERLANIYEGLVRTDQSLRIEAALAVSFGTITDTTWEFRLRPNVRFHDGSLLTYHDVEQSILAGRNSDVSQIQDFLQSIERIEKIDDEIFHIKTTEPDPLLLQKLALVSIFPARQKDTIAANPVGTGPYMFEELSANGSLNLSRSQDYWGPPPKYERVTLLTVESKDDRLEAVQKGKAHIVADMPPEYSKFLPYKKMQLITQPSTEVNFLLFNFAGPLQNKTLREAVSLVLDPEEIERLGFGFAKAATQYVPQGVFGYDPDIKLRIPNQLRAAGLMNEYIAKEHTAPAIALDLPKGLETLGDYVKEKLGQIGVTVNVGYHDPDKFRELIASKRSHAYFLGWRTELGDSAEFLGSVAHSTEKTYGQFNHQNYANQSVDRLIEEAKNLLDTATRGRKLRSAMRIITEEDLIGVPLFSPEILYAVSEDVIWKPRLDGYLYAFEVQ